MLWKIKNYIKQNNMIEDGDVLVVGVSGGADSVALIHILQSLSKDVSVKLHVVHIHHGIRKEASEDADFVKALCNDLGLPFYLYCADIPLMAKEQGKSEEEMGRDYRYQCFDEVARSVSANKIAVAHHLNDQAETILFHIIRGTDLKGLTGMRPVSKREDKPEIIRPLLSVTRVEIEEYLNSSLISWKEDITNRDTDYSRNALRNIIIPAMEDINAQVVTHITRLGMQVAQYEGYMDKQVWDYIDKYVNVSREEIILDREKLQETDDILKNKIIYELLGIICNGKKDISHEHVMSVNELLDNQSGKKIMLPYGVTAILVYEKLIIRKSLQQEKHDGEILTYIDDVVWKEEAVYKITLNNGGQIRLECKRYEDLVKKGKDITDDILRNSKNNYTKYFDCDTIRDKLCVRTSDSMDYICINENGNQKKLSRYFKDEKISTDIRKSVPVLALGKEILCIFGYRRCEKYKVTENTKHVLIAFYKGEENGSY